MFTLLEIQWPPPVYEMPTYVPFDASAMETVGAILKGNHEICLEYWSSDYGRPDFIQAGFCYCRRLFAS